jgi:hypothetical protein
MVGNFPALNNMDAQPNSWLVNRRQALRGLVVSMALPAQPLSFTIATRQKTVFQNAGRSLYVTETGKSRIVREFFR